MRDPAELIVRVVQVLLIAGILALLAWQTVATLTFEGEPYLGG
jgi:hypothetical protein